MPEGVPGGCRPALVFNSVSLPRWIPRARTVGTALRCPPRSVRLPASAAGEQLRRPELCHACMERSSRHALTWLRVAGVALARVKDVGGQVLAQARAVAGAEGQALSAPLQRRPWAELLDRTAYAKPDSLAEVRRAGEGAAGRLPLSPPARQRADCARTSTTSR